MKIKLGFKISSSFLIVALIPFLALSLLIYFGVKQNIRQIVEKKQIELITEIGRNVERTVFTAFTQTKALANNPIIISNNSSIKEKLFEMEKIQSFYGLFEDITLLDPEGTILASTSYDFRGIWKLKEWFKEALSGHSSVSPVHAVLAPFRLVVVFCVPIFDDLGKVKAVMAGQLHIDTIKDLIGKFQVDKQGDGIFILDKEGNYIVHSEQEKLLYKLEPKSLRDRILKDNASLFEFNDSSNIRKVCVFSQLQGYKDYKGQNWTICFMESTSKTFAIMATVRRNIIFAALLGIVLIIGSSAILTNAIVRPIKNLSAVSDKIARGVWDVFASESGKDEIADLGRAFNNMKDELKCFQDVIIAQSEQLAVTLRSISDAVITTDISGIIILLNETAEKLCGIKQNEARGRKFGDLIGLIDRQSNQLCDDFITRALKQEFLKGQTFWLKGRDEMSIMPSISPMFDKNNNVIGTVVMLKDVTEEEKLRLEVAKVQKLETVGIIAGGIAHDFNNILTAIVGNLSIAKLKVDADKDKELFDLLDEADKASFEARQITKQMLVFSKGGAPVKQVFKINDMLQKVVEFTLRATNCKAAYSIPDDLWLVEIDTGQIRQVINNLVINAAQAMSEGGMIYVSAKNLLLEKKILEILKEGLYVVISIRDEGSGISLENLQKIFDPFFTTKLTGNGLGLASVFSIIKKHNGYILVDSTLGKGTTFDVYLPAVINKNRLEQAGGGIVMGKGRILVMDDEEQVRNIFGLLLKAVGYEVEFAEDGEQAVKMYTDNMNQGTKFDAVILDLTIKGGKGGKEVIKELLKIDSSVKAIVSSGYANDTIMANFPDYGFQAVVEKPFRIEDLTRILGEVLSK
ncbi:MAG: response regulator [Candidatus Omnitrophica bacterium]|nr:response regulator [Candidatus Omnitrophota bacterium]